MAEWSKAVVLKTIERKRLFYLILSKIERTIKSSDCKASRPFLRVRRFLLHNSKTIDVIFEDIRRQTVVNTSVHI